MSKKFVLTITQDIEGNVVENSVNEGFNAAELLGFLILKQRDILEQMRHPEKFVRKIVDGDKTVEIKEAKDDDASITGCDRS